MHIHDKIISQNHDTTEEDRVAHEARAHHPLEYATNCNILNSSVD